MGYVVRPKDPTACWLWIGAIQQQGYGLWTFYPPDMPRKKLMVAHRVMYSLVHGAIPDNMELDHLCRNKTCVNPDHLEIVTHKENLARIPGHGYCNQGHDLSLTRVKISEKSSRCRVCYYGGLEAAKAARRARGLKKNGRPKAFTCVCGHRNWHHRGGVCRGFPSKSGKKVVGWSGGCSCEILKHR